MIEIPEKFMAVSYAGECYPGAVGVVGIEQGANCQQFAYELLRHFGRSVPDLRSSDLWADEISTERVGKFAPLDLLFFSETAESWGAHIGVYLGDGKVIHLSKQVGFPEIRDLSEFGKIELYKILLGANRARLHNGHGR